MRMLLLTVALAFAYGYSQPAAQQVRRKEPPNSRGAATKAFLDRVQEYATFHDRVEKMVLKLDETASSEDIANREAQLAAALIKQRPNARPGDFFIEQYQPYLVEIIEQDFARRSTADRKALIMELPEGVEITVNSVYPESLPLVTFPATLLQKLPKLPPVLEYGIVDRHLILRDVKGNVIVDVLRNVFPIPK